MIILLAALCFSTYLAWRDRHRAYSGGNQRRR